MQDQDPSSAHLYDANSIPILGRTRCYWVILNAALEFVYLDPILEVHLGDQVRFVYNPNFFRLSDLLMIGLGLRWIRSWGRIC